MEQVAGEAMAEPYDLLLGRTTIRCQLLCPVDDNYLARF